MTTSQPVVSTPYVGPRPFGSSDKDTERFFGREQEIDAILSRLYGQPVTLVCAPSGAGKTSIFNAGVTPRLRQRDVQVLPTARVGGIFAEELETGSAHGVRNVYMHNALMTLAPEQEPSALVDMTFKQFLTRWDAERQRRRDHPGLRVVAFDQFEEIFTTYRSGSQREQAAFFKQVAQALNCDPDLRALFLMREEYLAQLEPFTWLLPPGLNAYFRLEPLDADAALQAITGPLEMTVPRRSYADGVAEALVRELRKVPRQGTAGGNATVVGPYVEPMQLQGVCELLWLHLPPDATTISHEHRRRYGNVNRALATLYERAIRQAVEDGADERTLRDWFEHRLITPVRTRGTVYSDGQQAGDIPMPIVRLLEDSHILRVQNRAGLPWYELAHDRWIGPILESNGRWRASIRNPLTEPAKVWADKQQPENLLRGQRLKEATRWADKHGSGLNPRERRFLAASQREAEVRTREKNQAAQLERMVRILQSYEVIASANASLGEDPERSVLLALYAVAATSAVRGGTVPPDAEDALHHSLQALRIKRRLAHRGKVRALAASPDGRRLATAGEDGTVGVWEMMSARRLFTLSDQPLIFAIAYSRDGTQLATACIDGTARIWHFIADEQMPILLEHPGRVFGVDFSPDGQLATACGDGMARIWDAASGKQLLQIDHKAPVLDVAFSPDGSQLGTASYARAAKVWDAATGEKMLTLAGHESYVECMAFSPDGRQIATGSQDLTAKVWDSASGNQLRSLSGHTGTVSAVAFSPDSALLATGSLDSTAKLWDWRARQAIDTLRGHHKWITGVAFGEDGQTLATAGWDDTARIWDVPHGRETQTFTHGGQAVLAVAFSADSSRIAAAESGGAVRVLESGSGLPVATIFGHVGPVRTIAFSPDGTRLATGGDDWRAKVWDAASGRELQTLTGHAGRVVGIHWSPDGRTVATGGQDQAVKVWEIDSAEPPRTISFPAMVGELAFSPDGRRLATASSDGTAQVWDLHGGRQPLVLRGDEEAVYDQPVTAVAFSPDGKQLGTGSQNGVVRIWDTPGGALRSQLSAHSSAVSALAFSPDGSQLGTASWDSTAKLWDLGTGKQLITLSGHTDKLQGVAFSPDGRLLATVSDDGTTRLHVVKVHDLVNLARQRVTRGLVSEECHSWLQRSEPDQPNCPKEITAVGLFVKARSEAEEGLLDDAAATLREAHRLDSSLGADPDAEARQLAVAALLKEARDHAARKDVEFAARALQAAAELDPDLGLHSDMDARRMVTAHLIEEARWLAYGQNLEAATSKLQAAAGRWAEWDLDSEVRRVAAMAQVSRGADLARSGEIEYAVAAYQRAEELYPGLDIPPSTFNILCWFGSLYGFAAQVQGYGDRAVQLMSHPYIRDTRGLARALNGDLQGAIEDFRSFVEWEQGGEWEQAAIERRRQWIASLQAGENPFNQEVLADLRNE